MTKTLVVAAMLLSAPLAFADGKLKPGSYKITVTHEMTGMPFVPPPTTLERCITPEDAANPGKSLAKQRDNCETKESKVSPGKVTFSVVCHEHGGTQTGSGEISYTSDGWKGTMTIEMQNPRTGQAMKMVNHIDSVRTGDCAAAK